MNLICCDATTGKTPAPAMRILESPIGPLRAAAVREILVAAGVPAQKIENAGRGERELLVKSGDEVAEPKNRRVEISVR